MTGNFVLHHLPHQAKALHEARRVLVAGGRIGLTARSSPERNRFLGVFIDAVTTSGAAVPRDLPPGPPMTVTDAGYGDQLAGAGFEAITVEHLEWTHRFANADALWDGLMAASVRTAALIELQPPIVRDGIRREFDIRVGPLRPFPLRAAAHDLDFLGRRAGGGSAQRLDTLLDGGHRPQQLSLEVLHDLPGVAVGRTAGLLCLQ